MEKKINGRRYNTETAKHVQGALYRKSNGEYFLYDEDGITVLTYQTAREWASDNLGVETYARHFGTVTGGGKKVIRTFSLTEGVVEIIKREAAETGESISDVVARAVMFAYGS